LQAPVVSWFPAPNDASLLFRAGQGQRIPEKNGKGKGKFRKTPKINLGANQTPPTGGGEIKWMNQGEKHHDPQHKVGG